MTTNTILSIQHYKEGRGPINLDLALVYKAESFLGDIAIANRTTAKMLVATFGQAYVQVGKLLSKVKYDAAMAAVAARKRRSVLLLDEIPAMAKEKGLASARAPTGSEDVREAFFYADPEYIRIEESRAALEATQELLLSKLIAMKMAFEACKHLLGPGESASFTAAPTNTPDPNGGMVEREMERAINESPAVTVQSPPTRKGWGKPTYDQE